jgi:glycosyltransferase involved in cell wall biosynthesis
MDISFIIPAYNEEKYLGLCLESIQKELGDNPGVRAEIIVVDNASTDRTAQTAASFAGVKLIHEPRKGIILARQAGAAAATGELLAHVDADNILPRGWVEIAVKKFSSSPNLVALSGPLIYYELPKTELSLIRVYYRLATAMLWFGRHVLHFGSMIQGGNFVARARAWKKMEKISPDFKFYGEDTILAKHLARLGEVEFNLHFPIYSSNRRLKNEGLMKTALHYVLNYFSVTFFNKPATKKYTDVRGGK